MELFNKYMLNIFINRCNIYLDSLTIEERWDLKRVYLFSVISCITANIVTSSLVPHEKFIENH